jgi:hypothetical protein
MPVALTLIEAIAGREKAETVARDLGLPEWDARHDSREFLFTRPFALTTIGNTIALWKHERLGLVLQSGVDEVALALVADAWSRIYRSRAVTWSASEGASKVAPQNPLNVCAALNSSVNTSSTSASVAPSSSPRRPRKRTVGDVPAP